MTYGVSDTVKNILTIDSAITTFDDEIDGCIVSSDAYVDSILAQNGLTVPSPTPQNIIDASNYYAAYYFRKRRDPQSAWIFFLDAEKFKDAYINSQPSGEALPFAVGNINTNDDRAGRWC